MSDFVTGMKFLNVGLIGLGLYSAIEANSKIKTEKIKIGTDALVVDRSFIVGGSIIVATLGLMNWFLLSYIYNNNSSLNLWYKLFGMVVSGAILVISGFLLSEYLLLNYYKTHPDAANKEDLPQELVTVGLVLGGLGLGISLFLLIQILVSWGSVNSKKMRL
tara:strand:+ start:4356 stop:4841 length:486 start_codon:yes stop_codon:yes gene_type:complete